MDARPRCICYELLSAKAFMYVYECITPEKKDIAAWQKTQKRQSLTLYIVVFIAIVVIIVWSITKLIAIAIKNRPL